MMKREILRLAGAMTRSAFISVRRLSAFYNVPEKTVRRELTNMAEENWIRLAGWGQTGSATGRMAESRRVCGECAGRISGASRIAGIGAGRHRRSGFVD
jgi:hypothetical protein